MADCLSQAINQLHLQTPHICVHVYADAPGWESLVGAGLEAAATSLHGVRGVRCRVPDGLQGRFDAAVHGPLDDALDVLHGYVDGGPQAAVDDVFDLQWLGRGRAPCARAPRRQSGCAGKRARSA